MITDRFTIHHVEVHMHDGTTAAGVQLKCSDCGWVVVFIAADDAMADAFQRCDAAADAHTGQAHR